MLVLTDEAEADSEEAFDFYEGRNSGLGRQFLAAVRACTRRIQALPKLGTIMERDIRRVMLKVFPYGIFYYVEPTRIVVIAVFHASRDPDIWKARR